MGPNADIKKWEEEQMGIAMVRFGAKDSKERNKVRWLCFNVSGYRVCQLFATHEWGGRCVVWMLCDVDVVWCGRCVWCGCCVV